jgi:hypothetical protein
MGGNGAFAKANEILSVEDAIVAAAHAANLVEGHLHPRGDLTSESLRSHRMTAALLGQAVQGLAAYVDALVKVRGT